MVRAIRRNIVRCSAPKGTSPNAFLHAEWTRMKNKGKKRSHSHIMF